MDTPRWHFRFENFLSAYALLDNAVLRMETETLSDLELAGTIQRFEICWELAWKSLRDYLTDTGKTLAIPSAINVIRGAFEINLIEDGDAWVAAMQARNKMSHEYDCHAFEQIASDISLKYLPLFTAVKGKLESERDAGN